MCDMYSRGSIARKNVEELVGLEVRQLARSFRKEGISATPNRTKKSDLRTIFYAQKMLNTFIDSNNYLIENAYDEKKKETIDIKKKEIKNVLDFIGLSSAHKVIAARLTCGCDDTKRAMSYEIMKELCKNILPLVRLTDASESKVKIGDGNEGIISKESLNSVGNGRITVFVGNEKKEVTLNKFKKLNPEIFN